MEEKHEMEYIEEKEGTEVWKCPICGRMYLVEWLPFRRVVLKQGESPNVPHNISKGGLNITGIWTGG